MSMTPAELQREANRTKVEVSPRNIVLPSVIEFKRGDTFLLECIARDVAGSRQSLTGWNVRSQIRDVSGSLLAELTVTMVDAATGSYTLEAAATSTQSWTVGKAYSDIEYIDPAGVVRSTETVEFSIIEDQTR